MAYNRRMRKFEGTCYIPGEQLAMMAKYYRGANLNLNLTLFEDDLTAIQETLDQSCWCSKLSEVDRMKMSHMKGNEWRIAHDHCLEAEVGPGVKRPQVFPQRSKSAVGRVERGTSALSLYDRERGLVRVGRYQRNPGPSNRRIDFDGRQCRRDDYNHPRDDGEYFPNSQNVRDDYDSSYRRDNYYDQREYNTRVAQNVLRTDPNLRGPPNKTEMESEAISSPEVPKEIRCAVCNVETCLVCKNHLYSLICQCKCPVANAGLCSQCNQQLGADEEQVAQESGGTKTDMSSMMLTMMMSSILKQFSGSESVCCCKPGKDNSETISDSSDERVHKVYLYDREDQKKCRRKSMSSSDSSLSGNCCKCSQKPKRATGKEVKEPESSDEDTNFRESGASQKRQSTQDDTSKASNRKPVDQNYGYNKSRKADYASNKHRIANDEVSSKTNRGSIGSKNVQFSTRQMNQGSERFPSKSLTRLGIQTSEPLATQRSIPDLESLNLNNEEPASGGDDSCVANGLREFIACLPKIQLDLQNLVSKLNQMDLQNNQPLQQDEPILESGQRCSGEKPTGNGFPLPSAQQFLRCNPPGLSHNHAHTDSEYKKVDSEIKHSPYSCFKFPESEKPLEGRKVYVSNELTQFTNEISPKGALKSHRGNWSHDRNPVQSHSTAFPLVVPERSNFGRQPNPSKGFHKKSVTIDQYKNEVSYDGIQSLSNVGFTDHTQMREKGVYNDYEKSKNSSKKVLKTIIADTMPSTYEGETNFQSYNRSSAETSVQGLSDYASFTDNKCHTYFPDTAVQQTIPNPMNRIELTLADKPKVIEHKNNSNLGIISKCPRNLSKDRTLLKTRSVFKVQKRTSFKTKKRNPFSLEKLVQGCHSRGSESCNENPIDALCENLKVKVNQGVGPGIFRRSKYGSTLGLLEATRRPKGRNRLGFLNMPKGDRADQTMLKITNSYAQREIDSQSYIVSSVDVQAIDGSSSGIIKMVQGIASSYSVNVPNAHSGAAITEEIKPLLTFPRPTRSDARSGEALEQRVFLDSEVGSNTPVFLRKSLWQVEQLKKAHAAIRAMINNVNDVIDQIDSDSKIGIKSKVQRQSYFVHDNVMSSETQGRNDGKFPERKTKRGDPCKCGSDEQNPEVREMFLSVNRVMDSVLSPSEQSALTQESNSQSGNTTPVRAHRDFFVLKSNSATTAFTESLRRSLENDTSRSIPLMTEPLRPSPERENPHRTRSTRPLKKRSWFPFSKPR